MAKQRDATEREIPVTAGLGAAAGSLSGDLLAHPSAQLTRDTGNRSKSGTRKSSPTHVGLERKVPDLQKPVSHQLLGMKALAPGKEISISANKNDGSDISLAS